MTVANKEWVCTTALTSGLDRIIAVCMGVSEEGLYFPSITFPSKSTRVISSAVIVSYSIPLGVIATTPSSSSLMEILPLVPCIRPSAFDFFAASTTISLIFWYFILSSFLFYPIFISFLMDSPFAWESSASKAWSRSNVLFTISSSGNSPLFNNSNAIPTCLGVV